MIFTDSWSGRLSPWVYTYAYEFRPWCAPIPCVLDGITIHTTGRSLGLFEAAFFFLYFISSIAQGNNLGSHCIMYFTHRDSNDFPENPRCVLNNNNNAVGMHLRFGLVGGYGRAIEIENSFSRIFCVSRSKKKKKNERKSITAFIVNGDFSRAAV